MENGFYLNKIFIDAGVKGFLHRHFLYNNECKKIEYKYNKI